MRRIADRQQRIREIAERSGLTLAQADLAFRLSRGEFGPWLDDVAHLGSEEIERLGIDPGLIDDAFRAYLGERKRRVHELAATTSLTEDRAWFAVNLSDRLTLSCLDPL